MKDVFYTILVIWIIWRVFNGISAYNSRQKNTNNPGSQGKAKTGETTVDFIPPQQKKKINDSEGEYVDYEELK